MPDRNVVYRLSADITAFRAQLAQASAAVKKTAGDMTALDKQGVTMRRGIATLGTAAGKVGLVAAAGLGAAVFAAARFDKAMSAVQAATGESAANMSKLRDAAIQAGAQTVFSASEAAAGIENLAKAGVSTADILGGGLQGALDLAAAGAISVSEAAETAATAMTQFGLSGTEVPHIADLLAAAAGRAQGGVSDFGMALKQSGLVAAQMGVSVEETTGTLAAFASAGLLGSDAGTSFKTMLLRLANPSKEAANAMEKFGISAYDAQGNMVSISDLAGQVSTAFKGQTQATRDAALATIFGSDAIRAANVLYNEGSRGIKDWTNAVDDQGYAAQTAATRLNNLAGDLEQLRGSLETALIDTGEGSQGPLRGLVQNITAVVNAYGKLPSAAKGATAGLLGITAVTGGSIWFGTKVIAGVADAREALKNLGTTAPRTAAALRGVGAAAVGLTVMSVASDAVNAAVRSFDKAAPSLDRVTRNLQNLGDGRNKWGQLELRGLNEELGSLTDVLDTANSGMGANLAQTEDWLGKIPVFGSMVGKQIETVDAFTTRSLVARREAQATVEALDQGLMTVAESAGPRGALKAFHDLADAQGLTTDQTRQLMGLLPQFNDLMRDTGHGVKDAEVGTNLFGRTAADILGVFDGLTGASRRAAGGIADVGNKSHYTDAQLKAMSEALQKAQDEARGVGQEFFGLGEKLDKAKVSLGAWLRDLEKQAVALRDFRINAQQAAKRGLDDGLIASLEAAGPAGALRMKQLADATDAEITRANKAWRAGQREIDKYVDATVKVPRALATEVTTPGLSEAQRGINATIADMRVLDGTHAEITITTVRRNVFADGNSTHAAVGSGTGGTFASGGFTGPGGKYDIAGVVHRGEVVIPQELVKRDWAMLSSRYGHLPGFDRGGLVTQPVSASVSQHVEFAPATVDIRTPWGTQSVELMARVADSRIEADRRYRDRLDDRD